MHAGFAAGSSFFCPDQWGGCFDCTPCFFPATDCPLPYFPPPSYVVCDGAYAPTYASEPFYFDDCYFMAYGRDDEGSYYDPASDPGESEADVWLRLGEVLFRSGDFERAAEAFRKAVAAAPDAALPRIALGVTLFALGSYAEAAVHLRWGIELDPGLLEARVDRRSFYADPKTFDRRLEALLDYLVEHPFDAPAHFVAGYMLYFTERQRDALIVFTRLKSILSEDPVAELFLARLSDSAGDGE